MGFKTVKHVTLPLLKMAIGVIYYLKFDSRMETGRQMPARMVKNPTTGVMEEKLEEPAVVAEVTILEACKDKDGTEFATGEVAQILCPTVLVKELDLGYPEGAYKGKSFSVRQDNLANKRYKAVQIAEVEFTPDEVPAPPAEPSTPVSDEHKSDTGSPAPAPAKASKK